MFAKKPKSRIQIEMDSLVEDLRYDQLTSEEYGVILERIVKLHKIEQDNKPNRVDPNTAALIAANILGIVLIIRHEDVNVISSKALSFVLKPR